MSIEKIIFEFENQQEWTAAINNRQNVHELPAIYSIITSTPFPRIQGHSRILYIGKTACLGGKTDRCRLYGYRYAPDGQHGSRIRTKVSQIIRIGHSVHLKWRTLETEQEASRLEIEYLASYAQEHIELPPLNRKS